MIKAELYETMSLSAVGLRTLAKENIKLTYSYRNDEDEMGMVRYYWKKTKKGSIDPRRNHNKINEQDNQREGKALKENIG